MGMFLGMIGFLGFFVAIGVLIYAFVKKKGKLKKQSLIGLLIAIILFSAGAALMPDDDSDSTTADKSKTEQTTKKSSTSKSKQSSTKESTKKSETSKSSSKASSSSSESVPREYKNALSSAKDYLDTTAFSKQGLYDQLTSEVEGYPAEAAQYAVDNCNADWNEQALKCAKEYQESVSMSDNELYEQLTSEEKFTAEQAQYAIDNLPK